MGKLIDCVSKAEAAGLLSPAERAALLARADQLSRKMNREEAERVAVEEGKLNAGQTGRVTKNKTIASDVSKNVAYAAYMEEMRNAQATFLTQEHQALQHAKAAMEGQVTGVPPEEPAGEPPGTAETRTFLATLRATPHYLKPTDDDRIREAVEFSNLMAAVPGTGKVTANRTVVMMQGAAEPAVVMGWTSESGANLTIMVNTVAAHAGRGSHDVATISREIFAGEENSNARPGLEITFAEPIHISRAQGILDFMRARGVDGAMLRQHEESGLVTDYITGITLQVIPELNKQPSTATPDTLLDLADELLRGTEVKSIEHKLYDTLVLTRTDYGKNGILAKSPGAVRSAAWSDRAHYSVNPTTAKERVQRAGEKAPGAAVTVSPEVVNLLQPGEVLLLHASPHHVLQFSLTKIGTGEGRQAYGWGLYFAENPRVQEAYFKQFGGEGTAHKYSVAVKVSPNALLDFDKSLKEQSQQVKDALKKLGLMDEDGTLSFKAVTPGEKPDTPNRSGHRLFIDLLYSSLIPATADVQTRARLLSELLNSAGIKGIRYLDAFSRKGQANPTHNYVIFDDKAIRILEKDGQRIAKPTPTRETETAAALVAAGRAAPEVALPIYQRVFEKLLEMQRQHRAVIAGKEWSTAGEPEMTKLKILQAISELDALLKYMPAEIRGQVGGYFQLAKAAGSEQALTKFFRNRIAKMADLFEKHMQKEFRSAIDKLFEEARPKKTEGGVVKGHLTPETHAEVARLEGYTKMTGEDLFLRTMAIEAELRSGTLSPKEESERIIEQQDILAFGAMDEMSAAQLEHAHSVLQGAIKSGRTAWRMAEEVRLEAQRVKAEEVRNLLPEGSGPGIAEANARIVSNHVRDYINTHFNFSRLLGRILPEVSFLHDWQEATYRAEREEKAFVIAINDEIRNRILNSAGITGPLSMAKLSGILQKMFNTNLPVTKGKTANMFEAIHYVMAWERANERARMEKHGWNQALIDNLNNALSDPVSQAMIEAFRWGYDQIYQRANEVYKNTFGIELPREKFYVPMTYHGVGGDVEARAPLGGNIFGISGMTPHAIKGRVAHDHEMRQENAMTVFQSHLMEMSHWIHFTELGREMRNVLNDAKLKMALQQQLGEKGYTGLMRHLQVLIQGGPDRASDVKPVVDWIRYTQQNFQKVVLGFNLHVAGIQLDSFWRWATEIPIHRGLKQLAKGTFWSSWSKMANSDAVLMRLQKELPEEFQLAMQKSGVTAPIMLQAMQGGWWPLRFTDNAGTIVTGMIVYSDAIDQGMTEEQAFEKAQSAMQRLSQPAGVTTKSGFEISGSVGVKALTMFTTDPTFKTASYYQAWSDLGHGKNRALALQRIAAIHGFGVISQIAGNVIAAALSGGDDEDWDRMLDLKNYLAAAAVAPLQGYFFLGVLATSLIQLATGQKVYTRLAPVQAAGESLVKFAGPALKEMHDAFYDPRNFEPEKIYRSLNDAFLAIGTLVPGAAPSMALLRQVKKTYDDLFGKKKKKKRRE